MKEVFDGARALPPDARPAFIAGACAPMRRVEVERLLASHEAAASFLETPAMLVEQTTAAPTPAKISSQWSFSQVTDEPGRELYHRDLKPSTLA